MRLTLIENWADHWWKLWSVRLNAIGLALTAWMWFDPTSVLTVVSLMPEPVQNALPSGIVLPVEGVVFALAMIARLVRQPKLEKTKASA